MIDNTVPIEILEELKQEDYELYCHTRGQFSRFSEDDWDWIIHNFKKKLNNRINYIEDDLK